MRAVVASFLALLALARASFIPVTTVDEPGCGTSVSCALNSGSPTTPQPPCASRFYYTGTPNMQTRLLLLLTREELTEASHPLAEELALKNFFVVHTDVCDVAGKTPHDVARATLDVFVKHGSRIGTGGEVLATSDKDKRGRYLYPWSRLYTPWDVHVMAVGTAAAPVFSALSDTDTAVKSLTLLAPVSHTLDVEMYPFPTLPGLRKMIVDPVLDEDSMLCLPAEVLYDDTLINMGLPDGNTIGASISNANPLWWRADALCDYAQNADTLALKQRVASASMLFARNQVSYALQTLQGTRR